MYVLFDINVINFLLWQNKKLINALIVTINNKFDVNQMSVPYVCDKYVCTSDSLKETLEKYGVAIIPSVLSEEECKSMFDGMWNYFEHITQKWTTPIKRSKQASWSQFYELNPLHSMLIQQWHVGHAQVSWDLRQNEKIVDIFAKLWAVPKEELLVSFDGLSFSLPPEITKKGWHDGKTWYHTDQSYTRNNFECIQSWVTALDVNEGDSTLTVMEGSHKLHGDFAKKFGVTNESDWYRLRYDEEKFYKTNGCEYVKIKCPKGSMVFWDSRTIHCGAEPLMTRKESNFRAVVYLCYTPRALATEDQLAKKVSACKGMVSTSHWPHRINCFPSYPKARYGKPVSYKQINKPAAPVLTELGKKLAGF